MATVAALATMMIRCYGEDVVSVRVNRRVVVVGLAVLVASVIAVVARPAAAATSTLWPSSAVPAVESTDDVSAVELGVRFRSDVAGRVMGIRFFKGPANDGTHVGSLWSGSGQQLASATFTEESGSGWQQVLFASPVTVAAGTDYVASYHAPAGRYSYSYDALAAPRDVPPLHTPVNAGVFRYGATSQFPDQVHRATNYWVDVVFSDVVVPEPTPSASPGSPFQTSWIGNTYPGTDERPHVSQNCNAGYVLPDGSAACISKWDEGAREGAIYKDGRPVASLQWGHCCGGYAITADEDFLYVAVNNEGPMIRKYYHDGFFVPNGSEPLQTGIHAGGAPFGMAVVGNEVFVAVSSEDIVDVYRTSDLAYVRSFPVSGPGRMAADQAGRLWIRTDRQVRAYSTAGTDLGIAVTDTVDPTAVAVSPQGELLVGDDGRDRQQVYVYDIGAAPVRIDTIGVPGGMFAGPTPGSAGPLRFNGIVGVGKDTAGRLYVMQDHQASEGQGTGTNIDVYHRAEGSWTRDWQVLGLEFLDMADIDVASYHDGVMDAYTTNEHFRLDLNRPVGQQWTWVGQLANRFDNPTDADNGDLVPRVVYLDGQRFLATTSMENGQISLRRFAPGTEYAHIVTQIGGGAVGTIDDRGDVWWVHDDGIGVQRYTGLDDRGIPTFGVEENHVILPLFNGLGRVRYDAASDVMYVAGFTEERPHWDTADKVMGTVLARYDNWSRGNRTPRWTTVLPYFPDSGTEDSNGLGPSAMDIAGGRIYTSMLTDENPAGQSRMYAYDAATGAQVATWLPGPTVGLTGWIDVVDGVNAVRLPNGETVVFQEEGRCAKIMMYRIH